MADQLSTQQYKEKMQKQTKEAYAMLDEQTQKIMKSEKLFAHFLDLLAAHSATTVSNTLLLQAQIPDADPNLTAINTISEWGKRNITVPKDANGYYPRGIYQFVQDGYYTDDETGELRMKFKIVKGFDASQTNNPEYARNVMKAARPVKVFLGTNDIENTKNLALCNSSKVRCLVWDVKKLIHEDENISEETGVKYIPETKTIIIRSLSRENWFSRVAYEIAMGLFHQRLGSTFNRKNHTFEAGVISYLLCRYSGVDVSNFSFDLSKAPERYPDVAVFRAVLNDCLEISHDMAFRLNNKLNEHNKSQMKPPICV
ncbi:MAG: hypothetical protein ACI4N4_01950 [Candidatus Fimenecus sp.]